MAAASVSLDAVSADLVGELERVRAGETTAQSLPLRGAMLVEADLSDLDLSACDLSGADLSRANLEGARLFGAKLGGATLFEVKADGAELAGADLTGANLADGSFERAGFGRAVLAGADLSNARLAGASLTSADLSRAILAAADLRDARLCDVTLSGADLTHATLDEADLTGASVDGARFDHASLAGTALTGTRFFRRASWLAVDLRNIDFSGAYLLRDFIQDQNFLDEFRRQSRLHEWIYRLWWLTSDCGRSAFRWAACGAIIAMFFAGLYTQVGIDYGDYQTPLSPVYFSVVTFTTLGYGDALPTTTAAQAIVIAEVVAGYVMLGGLLSLITNKLARRAG
ncbi:MAG: pentapeptide repeat-containing protein [Planctomycetota bacterium]